ncbi:hypothetical protein BD770DRAFT_185872 [Pilaira anomala]|nr:hypothetical protein BD770DRAFT_185872 [Pilaira anomala]
MPFHKKRYSQDSACDDTKLHKPKRDDASIYSNRSNTSSMFSTSSRMSKIPNAVKSSVKFLVRRKKEEETTSIEPIKTTTKRHTTLNFGNLFHSRHKHQIKEQEEPTTILVDDIKSKRRNSVVNLASRLIYNKREVILNKNLSNEALVEEEEDEEGLEHIVYEDTSDFDDFVHHESDSKSEKIIKPKKEEPWVRQRAKSCQESKAPLLQQLANKGSRLDLPENDSIPYKSNNTKMMLTSDLPLFKGLVTTTLTTLHTRLTNECDRVLSIILLADHPNPPQEQLLSIIADLYKMTEMVNWGNQEIQKKQIKETIQEIENSVLNQELNIITVKDFISSIKQVMNECICQYYKVVEKAMIIPSKGYKIEGINKSYG